MDNTITTIEMCAGYGGIGLGLKNIFGERMRTLAYCELEGFAQANLISKMEKGLMDVAPLWNDLKTFPYESFHGLVDILIAGYPCQPFSAAGKRAGKEDPRHLWPWIADGIRLLQPRICFFENVEGHISLGLSSVISDLEELGYKVSWGIFSAREVGAPHQRKRVFIMAHLKCAGLERLDKWDASSEQTESIGADSRSSCQRSAWPSRPGEPQHGWEPPRVVANSILVGRGRRSDGDAGGLRGEIQVEGSCCSGGEAVVNSIGIYEHKSIGRESEQLESWDASEVVGNAESKQGTPRDHRGESGSLSQQEQVESGGGDCGALRENNGQAQSCVGLHFDESSSILGQTLTLNPYGDNVYKYENLSKKRRAREILFEVWTSSSSETIQWTTGGLQYFFAEKILQSGMQLDGFTQRICYFVWCVQTGYQAQGWGLSGMSVYESCGNTSQGQKPIEQFKRELGYAMCQLSYEIALERGQDSVEATGIMQGLRESSERAWSLSEALPEMEEVWRSSLDQKVWENGCFIEASSKGNRTDELRLLGNGVVPATAERAFRTLLNELNI